MNLCNYLITGGAGFIGTHVTRELLRNGDRVEIIDNLSTGQAANIPRGAVFRGPFDCADLKAENIHPDTVVIHLAAHPRCNASLFAPIADAEKTYIPGLKTLSASLKAGVRRFVLVSSMSVYGDAESPYCEDMAPLPRDPYAVHKRALELVVMQECRAHGIPFTILRPQHVFGPSQRCDLSYRNVIARWIRLLLADKPLPVFGSLDLKRAFSPVTLISRAIAAAASLPIAENQIINLGSRQIRSLREIAGWLHSFLPQTRVRFDVRPNPPTLLEVSVGKVDKMESFLGVRESPHEAEDCLTALIAEIQQLEPVTEISFEPELLEESHAKIYARY